MRDILTSAAGGASAAVAFAFQDVSVPYLGVPLPVVACCLAGALFGIAYGEAIQPRAKMYQLVLANTFLSALLVTILPLIPMFHFLHEIPQAPLGGAIAFFSRWTIPVLIVKIPQLLKKVGGNK